MTATGERLVTAYRRALEQAHKLADRAGRQVPVGELLDRAQETLGEMQEYTREEIGKVRYYLGRDLQDMLQHARDSERDLADWLRMDLVLVESSILDMLLSVADPTRVALEEIAAEGFHPDDYLAGEVTGPGNLVCTACGERQEFAEPATIAACTACGEVRFARRR